MVQPGGLSVWVCCLPSSAAGPACREWVVLGKDRALLIDG